MLTYFIRQNASEQLHRISTPPSQDAVVYGESVSIDDVHLLAETYELDESILRDVLDTNELPRVELRDEALYVFVRRAHRGKHGQVITSPVLLVVKDSIFIDISPSQHEERDVELLSSRTHVSHSVDSLLCVFAAIIEEYEVLMQRTGRHIKDTGQRLRTHEVTNSDFIKFVTVEDNLNEYHMNLNGMLVVAQRLQDTTRSSRDKEAVEDIVLYIRQLLVAIESYNQSITSIRNAYGTIANNVLNQRMKTLTMLTLLIALPNVFYGMYGMNVPLPFQDAPWAYGVIVVFTFTLILLIYGLAKRFRLF